MKGFAPVLLMALLLTPIAWADIVTPPGLNPGDQFRIAFVSSGVRDATSSDITVYDDFITGLATAAELTYNGASVTWFALGSTESVTANSRLPASASSPGLYLLNGVKVADNTNDLWDGTIDSFISVAENGDVIPGFAFVFSGATASGGTQPFAALGAPSVVQAGVVFGLFEGWINTDAQPPATQTHHIYGYSEVLTVPLAVPEPASVTLLGLGALGLAGYGWRRRRAGSTAACPVP